MKPLQVQFINIDDQANVTTGDMEYDDIRWMFVSIYHQGYKMVTSERICRAYPDDSWVDLLDSTLMVQESFDLKSHHEFRF